MALAWACTRLPVAALAVSSLLWLGPSTPSPAASARMSSASVRADSSCWTYRDAERAFAKKTNLARAAAGVGKLKLDPEVSKAARKHAREMVDRNLLYHTPSEKLRRRVTNWSTLGENVGVGGGVASLQQAFLASPAHRANILYRGFTYVGIGVIEKDGRMWVTVIFDARNNPGTRLRMPRC